MYRVRAKLSYRLKGPTATTISDLWKVIKARGGG
jgi:hypothetical protein